MHRLAVWLHHAGSVVSLMMQFERWSLLIVRAALVHGVTRFPDFAATLDIDPNLLASRLGDLVNGGILTVSADAAHPEQSEYVLTTKGRDLAPTIDLLNDWSNRWAEPVAVPAGSSVTAIAAPIPSVAAGPTAPLVVDLLPLLRPSEPTNSGDEAPDAAGTPPTVAIEIAILGTFALRVGGKPVGPLSVGSQRLLVFLALHDRAVGRAAMAGRMWPDASDEKAGISLRSALSRLDTPTREAILVASAGLSLADTVVVDLRPAQALARRLLQTNTDVCEADLGPAAVAILSTELLPDWYDDWVIAEAEDWRQLRMNALEALAGLLIERGRLADAAGAARAAMKVEPLRESAHAALIRVHLAEGNQSEALRVFDRYRVLLSSALGLHPTDRLNELVQAISVR